jgi:glycosyltransferase involved in cell wall biosynthesis
MTPALGAVVIDASAIHATSGGAGTYLRALVTALPTVGVRPIVITRRNDLSAWTGADSVHRIAPSKRPLRLLWEQTNLVRHINRIVPIGDVVLHSPHYTAPNRVPSRIHQVITIHDLTMFTRPEDHQRSKRVLFQLAVKRSKHLASVIIAVSHTTATAYSLITGRTDRIVVAPHGVDHARFRPAELDHERARDAAMLASADVASPFIVHLGTIEPRKQVPMLIEAVRNLQRERPTLQLVLAGQMWEGMHARLGQTAPHERRLGYVSDDLAVALLRNAAAVAYPSAEEGFGLPLLEAMACGTPVVGTASDVSVEVCGEAATLIPLNPQESRASRLAAALHDVLEGRFPSVEDARLRAATFTWEKCARDHVVAYQQSIQNSAS